MHLQRLAAIIVARLLWLQGVIAHSLFVNSTVQCRPCNGSDCRILDCRVPPWENVTVTCVYKNSQGGCRHHENTLKFHRLDSEGGQPINGNISLPGYKEESYENGGCTHRLTFAPVPGMSTIILQCLRTNHERRKTTYSKTLVIEVLPNPDEGCSTKGNTSAIHLPTNGTSGDGSIRTSEGDGSIRTSESFFCVILTFLSVLLQFV